MKPRPRPSTRPWTIGRLVIRAIQPTVPVRPMTSQKTPVNSPDAQIAPGEMVPAWVIAAVPMAFIGWIGTGVLKYSPATDLEEAERHEDADRIHLVDGDIPDHERDERAEVAEGAREFLQIVRISADPQRPSLLAGGWTAMLA